MGWASSVSASVSMVCKRVRVTVRPPALVASSAQMKFAERCCRHADPQFSLHRETIFDKRQSPTQWAGGTILARMRWSCVGERVYRRECHAFVMSFGYCRVIAIVIWCRGRRWCEWSSSPTSRRTHAIAAGELVAGRPVVGRHRRGDIRSDVEGLVHREHERQRAFDPPLADLGLAVVERHGAALAESAAVVREVRARPHASPGVELASPTTCSRSRCRGCCRRTAGRPRAGTCSTRRTRRPGR